jgi:hypothetical protein
MDLNDKLEHGALALPPLLAVTNTITNIAPCNGVPENGCFIECERQGV